MGDSIDGTAGCIVLLSGPPGAGKSTIAKEYVKQAKSPTIYIEGDAFWKFVVKPKPKTKRQHLARLVIKSMTLASIPFARAGYQVVVDFTVGPWYMDAFLSQLKDIPLHFIILCPSESVCAERAATREEGKVLDYSEYKELHEAFMQAEDSERYMIQNDVLSVNDAAILIKKAVEANRYLVSTLAHSI